MYQRVLTSGSDIPGWYADPYDLQPCGSVFNGSCITNPDPNSTGFFCQGVLSGDPCIQKAKVKSQGYGFTIGDPVDSTGTSDPTSP